MAHPERHRCILGIADSHDAGAALWLDGELVAASSEERFDRRKNSAAFPWLAINSVLRTAGIEPGDVERIALGSVFTPPSALRLLSGHRPGVGNRFGQFHYLLHAYILAQVLGRKSGLIHLDIGASRALLQHRLQERGFKAPLVLVDHHTAHAEAAWRTQPHDPCLVLTLDSMGDGVSVGVFEGRQGRLNPIFLQSSLAAIGNFYARITQTLGFVPVRHEGKVMGLAAYAQPDPALVRHFRSGIAFEGPGFRRANYLVAHGPEDPLYRVATRYGRAEVAAAAQAAFEAEVSAFARYWLTKTGHRHLALAGGAFANVRVNACLGALEGLESLWVLPHMGDGGLALGALMHTIQPEPSELVHAFWGPSWGEEDLACELRSQQLPLERVVDPEECAAELLSQGLVLARFEGRMEWGPRALGNRSILVRPDDPSVNDWLNKRLRRTEFMPFAPAVLAEAAPWAFDGPPPLSRAARFMTVCLPCTPRFQQLAPGVVHLDGTARPQIVHKGDAPRFHRILSLFQQKTGLPALINTSFNMHEEPIVCSPSDALRAWKLARLDAMLMGPFLLRRDGPS